MLTCRNLRDHTVDMSLEIRRKTTVHASVKAPSSANILACHSKRTQAGRALALERLATQSDGVAEQRSVVLRGLQILERRDEL